MKVCIFEDGGWEKLHPLTLFHPVFELRCGINLLWEKIARNFSDAELGFLTRDYLIPVFRKRMSGYSFNDRDFLEGGDLLLINGRLLMDSSLKISPEGEEEVGVKGDEVVYIRLRGSREVFNGEVEGYIRRLASRLPSKEIEATLITYPWDLINCNGEAIADDFRALGRVGIEGEFSPQAALVGDSSQIYVARGAQVHPFAALDSTLGPVVVDEGAIVYPNSSIQGPAYVGKKSKIVGGKVREGCSIGPVTMVGGEVEETIFQGYANKFHEGFIGHSYIGEWVNLGALTTNSDIKNNYSSVKVYVNGELMNSGELKVGSFIGDHAKLGIGTLLNTGTVIGACANVFGGVMPPKFVPSFAWGKGDEFVEFQLEKAVQTARVVMGRREVEMSEEDAQLIRRVYQITAEERKKWKVGEAEIRR